MTLKNRIIKFILSIKGKMLVLISFCLIAGVASNLVFTYSFFQNSINDIAKQSLKTSQERMQSLEASDIKMLSSTLVALLNNNEIKNAFIEKDREKLYALSEPIFKTLRENYKITHWYFHNPEPESTNFLRVHSFEKFGDVIERFTYKNSVQSKGFGVGKELGQTAFALRVVHPYYDSKGNLIGYMELGQEIEHFLQIMKQETGTEYGMFVSKAYLNHDIWTSARSAKNLNDNWDDMNDLVLIDTTTEDIASINNNIQKVWNGNDSYKRFSEGNKMYIQSVFPISDAGGREVGGVFIVQDITTQYNNLKTQMINSTLLSIVLFLIVGLVIRFILSKITSGLNQIVELIKNIAEGAGDLTKRIQIQSRDEVGELARWFNVFIDKTHGVVSEVKSNADTLTVEANDITKKVYEANQMLDHIARRISNITDSFSDNSSVVQEITASIEEVASGAITVAEESSQVTDYSQQVLNSANYGVLKIKDVEESIKKVKVSSEHMNSLFEELRASSGQINEIASMITGISEQTNLLALNAAIEAARAGDSGKGFAVVADEVRKLAEGSKTLADNITILISDNDKRIETAYANMKIEKQLVEASVEKATETNKEFEKILTLIEQTSEKIKTILNASNQQSKISSEMTISMSQLSESTQLLSNDSLEISTGVELQVNVFEEINRNIEFLNNMINNLKDQTDRFIV